MKKKYKPKKGVKIFSILIIFIVSFYLYGRYINSSNLKVYEKAIYNEKLPKDYNGLKIAHFTDLHYGRTTNEEMLKKVVKEINELNADIVIFTGDISDNTEINESNKKILTKYLNNINAKLFKFAIIGDYDKKYLDDYKEILANSNFILLDNENKLIYYNTNKPINFIGLTNTDNIDEIYIEDNFNITLIHKPDLIKNIEKSNIVFAGHSLGGQIRIPFIGGIKKIDGAKTYLDEYYKINGIDTYISNGIGTQDISIRMFNSPSITLYRLYNK
ncbi:MAG: hypothetical protein E7163_03505 [Firmicutes bacterium]|nr:hypothetical protein [Bacillota bacterium]